MPPQNMLLWHKNYFQLKVFESLKSLICLKSSASQNNSVIINLSPGEALTVSFERRAVTSHPNRHCHKLLSPIYSPKSPFIFPKEHCCFHGHLFFPPAKSFVLPEVPLCFPISPSLLLRLCTSSQMSPLLWVFTSCCDISVHVKLKMNAFICLFAFYSVFCEFNLQASSH